MGSRDVSVQENLIGRQLSWRVLLLSAIAILALVLTSWQSMVNSVEGLRYDLATAGEDVVVVLDEFMGRMVHDLWATADALGTQVDVDVPFGNDMLFRRALARQKQGFFELLWVAPDGEVAVSRRRVGVLSYERFVEQPWLATVQQDEVYIGVIDYAEYGVPFVNIAVPIYNQQRVFAGTLVARVDLTVLWDKVVTPRIGKTGLTYVIDSEQRLLFHRDVNWVRLGKQTTFDIETVGEAGVRLASNFEGAPTVFTLSAMEAVQWYVVSEQRVSEAGLPFGQQLFFPIVLVVIVVWVIVNTVSFTQREIVSPLRVLYEGVNILGQRDANQGPLARHPEMVYRIDVEAHGEFALLAETINGLAAQLYETINTLEQRVDERTQGLLAAAEVSRATTSVLDPDVLLRQTVDLVQERFDLYYVGLFLLDAADKNLGEEYAVLQAGTGVAGAQMLAAAHRLRVGGDTMIGQCVASGRARIALDIAPPRGGGPPGTGGQRFDNPLLPDTRSEMALPLRSHRSIIGAITVQSDKAAAFDEASILVMQTLADQVAVAIDNARLYAQTQAALREMALIQQRYLGGAWREFLRYKPLYGYKKTGVEIMALDATPLPGVTRALEQRETIVLNEAPETSTAQVVVPIRFRDYYLGALGFSLAAAQPLSGEQIAFVEALATQFGQAAENLRLVEATQRLAAREHVVGKIATRMRQSLDVDTVLKTAAEELRQALHTPEVTIRLQMPVGPQMPEVTDESSGSVQESGVQESDG